MRRFVFVSLLSLGLCFSLEAQEEADAALSVQVLAEEPGADGKFSADDLEDAATVLLTSKAPDIQVADDAPLTLGLQPTCMSLSSSRGYTCSLNVTLFLSLHWKMVAAEGRQGTPFDTPPMLRLWSDGGVLAGPPGNSLSHLREALDRFLDEPIAAWRRLGKKEQQCWISFLNDPTLHMARRLEGRTDAASAAALFLLGGPCRPSK